MSGSITGGHVVFLKRVKTGDYEHSEAVAHINFAVDEGADHKSTLTLASQTALHTVYTALGLALPKHVKGVVTVETTMADGDANKDAVAARKGRGTGAKPPAVPEAKPEDKDFDPLAGGQPAADAGSSSQDGTDKSSAGTGDKDFDPLTGSTGGADGSEKKSDATPLVSDADAADEFSSLPEEISDDRVMREITAKNAETKNTPAIRKLIGQYTPQDGKPHTAKEIPQENRAAFLIELSKVPAAS